MIDTALGQVLASFIACAARRLTNAPQPISCANCGERWAVWRDLCGVCLDDQAEAERAYFEDVHCDER